MSILSREPLIPCGGGTEAQLSWLEHGAGNTKVLSLILGWATHTRADLEEHRPLFSTIIELDAFKMYILPLVRCQLKEGVYPTAQDREHCGFS